jgi:hypothetical protein
MEQPIWDASEILLREVDESSSQGSFLDTFYQFAILYS